MHMNERLAILQDEENVKRKVLSKWRGELCEHLKKSADEKLALQHRRAQLLTKCLMNWHYLAAEIKKEEENEEKATENYKRMLLVQNFTKWQHYVQSRRLKKLKIEQCVEHYEKRIERKVFEHWKLYVEKCRERKNVVDNRFRFKNHLKLQRAFRQWRNGCKYLQIEKQKMKEAEHLYNFRLTMNVLRNWNDYVLMKALRKHENDQKVNAHRRKFDGIVLKFCLCQWQQAWNDRIVERLHLEKARICSDQKILAEVLKHWRSVIEMKRRKLLMLQQAKYFAASLFLYKFFRQWKEQFKEAQNEKTKNDNALGLWAFKLQEKGFKSWHGYVVAKKEARKRYVEAENHYQTHVAKAGVRMILSGGLHLKEARCARLAEKAMIEAERKLKLARKYADLWKAKILKHNNVPLKSQLALMSTPNVQEVIARRKPIIPPVIAKSLLNEGWMLSKEEYEIPIDESLPENSSSSSPVSIEFEKDKKIEHESEVSSDEEESKLNRKVVGLSIPPVARPLMPPSAFLASVKEQEHERIYSSDLRELLLAREFLKKYSETEEERNDLLKQASYLKVLLEQGIISGQTNLQEVAVELEKIEQDVEKLNKHLEQMSEKRKKVIDHVHQFKLKYSSS